VISCNRFAEQRLHGIVGSHAVQQYDPAEGNAKSCKHHQTGAHAVAQPDGCDRNIVRRPTTSTTAPAIVSAWATSIRKSASIVPHRTEPALCAIDNNARALNLLRDSFSAGEGTFRDLRKSVRAERTGYVDKVLFTACSRNSQGRDVETAADLVRTGRGRR
jgi:hypothetical protein